MNKISKLLLISVLGSLSLHAMEQDAFKNWVNKKRKEVTLAAPKSLLTNDQIYKEAEQNEHAVAIINATTQRSAKRTRKFAQSDPGSAKNMMTFINQKQKSVDFEDPELNRFAAVVALTEFAKPSNDLVLAMLEYAKLEESKTNNKPIEKTDEISDSEPVQESNAIPVKVAAQNRSPVVEKDGDEIMSVISDEEAPLYDFSNYDEDLFTAVPTIAEPNFAAEIAQIEEINQIKEASPVKAEIELVLAPIEAIALNPLEVAPRQKQTISPAALVQNPIEEIAPSPFEVIAPRRPFQGEIDTFNQALKKHCRLKGKELLDALASEITLNDPTSFLSVAQAINSKEAVDFAQYCIAKQK